MSDSEKLTVDRETVRIALEYLFSFKFNHFNSLLAYFILYKAEKPSVRPSIRSFLVAWISAVDARIDAELTRNEAPVFWDCKVYF